jgi:hypothetical protein
LEAASNDPPRKRCATLIKDKQFPDTSFKAPAVGVLSKLGEKIAGEAGKEAADAIVGKAARPAAEKAIGVLVGLLAGDAKRATKNLTKYELIDL